MASITANAGTFAHTDTAAWIGGVVPGVDDDVTIPSTATITVATAVTWTIGTVATPAAFCLTVGGTLTINGTVRLNSNARHSGALTGFCRVNAGGVLESNNPSTALVWNGNRGTLQLRGTGIGAARAFVRNGAGMAGFSYLRSAATNDGSRIDSEWGRFTGMTTLSANGFFADGDGVWRMIDTVVDACTMTSAGLNWPVTDPIEWRRVQQINSPNPECCTINGFSAQDVGVLRVFEDVAFDRQANFPVPGYTCTRVVFGQTPISLVSTLEMTDCVFADTSASAGSPVSLRASLLRGFRVRNSPAVGNWHGLQYSTAGTYTIDGIIFDGVVADENGDAILPQGSVTVTVQNVLGTKSAATGGSFGAMVTLGGSAATSLPVVQNCTWHHGGGDGGLLSVGEAFAGVGGMIPVTRNNCVVGAAAGNGILVRRQGAGAAANIRDLVTPAGVTNNNVRNPIAGGAGVGSGNDTVAGGDGVMFNTVPAASLNLDPAFVADTRNLSTWYRSVVGGAPGTRTADLALALSAMASQWGDSPVAGATIAAATAWIRAGYVPTNTALRTNVSANNGGWIGAVEGAADPVGGIALLRRRRR